MLITPLTRFKRCVREGKSTKGLVLEKFIFPSVTEAGDRQLKYVISTQSVDRDNDTVALDGWDLKNFLRSPVVLLNHNYNDFPIGKCVWIGIEDDALKAVVEFVPVETPYIGQKAECTYQLAKSGFMGATSVGFKPLDYEVANDRTDKDSWFPAIDYTRQELMEFSCVTVPANPEALIDMPMDENAMAAAQLARDAEIAKLAAATASRRARMLAYS